MAIASCTICFEALLATKPHNPPPTDEGQAHGTCPVSDVSATPCGHVFHTGCVSVWIGSHGHCPQCRSPVAATLLVKLFLAEEQYGKHKVEKDGATPNQYQTFIVCSAEERLRHAEEARDESQIIQDVLQCQLEDLQSVVYKLSKQLSLTEDQLQDKVQEISGLESNLLESRIRLEKLEQISLKASKATDAQRQLESENSALKRKIRCLKDKLENCGSDLTAQKIKIDDLEKRLAETELDLRIRSQISQSQISNNPDEIISIYESLDNLSCNTTRPKASPTTTLHYTVCSWLRNVGLILVFLTVFLGLFVVLPMRVFFTKKEQKTQ